jgi:hypothetical protein
MRAALWGIPAFVYFFAIAQVTAEDRIFGIYVDGNSLWQQMQVSNPATVAYVVGVSDGLTLARGGTLKTYCVPDNATGQQLHDVVKQWLAKNPARRHYAAANIVETALEDAFPCQK